MFNWKHGCEVLTDGALDIARLLVNCKTNLNLVVNVFLLISM